MNLYIFGDKHEIPKLCNDAVDLLIKDYEEEHAMCTNPALVYEETPAGSPLRRVLLAIYLGNPAQSQEVLRACATKLKEYPEFLLEYGSAVTEMLSEVFPGRHIANPCQYHRHEDGEQTCT